MSDMVAGDSKRRSLAKTISWRALASITTAVIAFTVMRMVDTSTATGGAKAAGVIGGIEVPSKLLLYYFHERAWTRISFGRA
ncbi:MAG: DUF2061 domain-containing protein [Planctomycetota bacterium]